MRMVPPVVGFGLQAVMDMEAVQAQSEAPGRAGACRASMAQSAPALSATPMIEPEGRAAKAASSARSSAGSSADPQGSPPC